MGVRDPRFTSKEHAEALSLRNVGALQSALGILKEPKVEKSLKQSEKMFKAIKESGSVVADVLGAFIGAGSAKDVFGDVVSSYSDYLSDMFWGDIVSAIDWGSITTAITDIMGPIFEGLGDIIGDGIETLFSSAPVGTSIGAAFGGLIGSLYGPMGAMIGTLLGAGIGYLVEEIGGGIYYLIEGLIHYIRFGPGEITEEQATLLYGEDIPDWVKYTPTEPEPYTPTPRIPGEEFLQKGTERVLRSGYKYIHRDESVIPAPYRGRTEALLMELLNEIRRARKDKAFKNMFKRR